jgi:large subunit ribosomal protein L28
MSRKCQITQKGSQRGCNVSHAHNKTLKRWDANLHWKRLFDSESGKWVRLKVSSRVLRTIDKKGLAQALRDHGLSLAQLSK